MDNAYTSHMIFCLPSLSRIVTSIDSELRRTTTEGSKFKEEGKSWDVVMLMLNVSEFSKNRLSRIVTLTQLMVWKSLSTTEVGGMAM